jgi:hypothetical protein
MSRARFAPRIDDVSTATTAGTPATADRAVSEGAEEAAVAGDD